MVLSIGEILFDEFPDYRRVGGAPFNFAYHLQNLGVPVKFISRVGRDPEGGELVKIVTDAGFERSDIQIDEDHSTGKVVVTLSKHGVPDFEIKKEAAYDYLEFTEGTQSHLDKSLKVIYFGTLIQRTGPGRNFVEKLLSRKGPETAALCDINLRKECYDKEIVARSVASADILKLNEDEMDTIRTMLGPDILMDDFPVYLIEAYSLALICLTRGSEGSEIFRGSERYSIGPADSVDIIDTVGAGDAYTAILAMGYINNWHPEKILSVASTFAAGICGFRGALPDTGKFYEQYIEVSRGSDSE